MLRYSSGSYSPSPPSSDDLQVYATTRDTELHSAPTASYHRALSQFSTASRDSTSGLAPMSEPDLEGACPDVRRSLLHTWAANAGWSASDAQSVPSPPRFAREGRWKRASKKFVDSQHYKFWHGSQLVFFGSYLNILLLLIPVAWILDQCLPDADTLVCIFCMVTFIPLVRLHDLATMELSARLGGSRTGLLNASMSNTVEFVIAIMALRKCELRVVQSSLIGSILSKLLLVLGMCFFAGGMRFSEQGFDSTAMQMHSSLLSLSVGAVLLPAAYHFALNATNAETQAVQKKDLLKMSRGVSIILLIIYVAYLLFQLVSHSHLYEDSNTPSEKLSDALKGPRKPRHHQGNSDACSVKTLDVGYESPYQKDVNLAPWSRATTPEPDRKGLSIPTFPVPFEGRPSSPSEVLASQRTNLDPTIIPLTDDLSIRRFPTRCSLARTVTLHDDEGVLVRPSLDYANDGLPHLPSLNPHHVPQLSWTVLAFLLAVVPIAVAFTADLLISSMNGVSTTISKEWIGLILLPVVSCMAECITAVNVSVKDQLTLSMSVAVGSTIQTALCVIPSIVLVGWMLDKPLALLFDPFESVVLYISVNIMGYVVAGGKSNWLEGSILVCLYAIVAVTFWFYPGSTFSSTLAACN